MKRIAYIYVLVDPSNGKVFYVGQTITSLEHRLNSHIQSSLRHRSSAKEKRIAKIIKKGLKPEILQVAKIEDPTPKKIREAEQAWMDFYSFSCKLTNAVSSGVGTVGCRNKINWTQEYLDLLGTIPDSKIAEMLNCDRKTVSYRRNSLGIPPTDNYVRSVPPYMGGWNAIKLPESIIEQLGTKPDYVLAKEAGVDKTVIADNRKKRGIPSYAKQTGNNGQFRSGQPHPYWSRKKEGVIP